MNELPITIGNEEDAAQRFSWGQISLWSYRNVVALG
jgi:hypothetical protein